MRHLLDSLLVGYPIGSLLLCRAATASRVIVTDGGERVVHEAREGEWQLLDGQQRVNALFSMLTSRGRYGRFYLHMTRERIAPGPATERRTKEESLGYLLWFPSETADEDPAVTPEPVSTREGAAALDGGSEPSSLDGFPERDHCLDLSRWYAWAEQPGDPAARAEEIPSADPAAVAGILHQIDPAFTAHLSETGSTHAADRLAKLLDAWGRPIPVLRAPVTSPEDILEVFTRINLGGVQVSGFDVYFAGIKTYWSGAETALDRVSAATCGVLTRAEALRLVSRLASRALDAGDPLPLAVDRLAGGKHVPLVAAMQALTAPESLFLERLRAFTITFLDASRLGYGLRLVPRGLWDEVFAWAATNASGSIPDGEASFTRNVAAIDAYLLGATLFRYPSVLGDQFRRTALREAAAAGSADKPFPTRRIAEVVRGQREHLTRGRASVPGLGSGDDRAGIANHSAGLLLAVAQRLPYRLEHGIDWDHIYPTARATRMRTTNPESGRPVNHPYRRFVNHGGNLWGLDSGANRSLQDLTPARKFDVIDGWAAQQDRGPYPIWPLEQWSITEQEVEQFRRVDSMLDDAATFESAMTLFRDLVEGRSERLLTTALDAVPRVRDLAADSGIDPEFRQSELTELATALGLSQVAARFAHHEKSEPSLGVGAPSGIEADLGPAWSGRFDVLALVVDRTTRGIRAHRGRSSSVKRELGYAYARFVFLPATQEYLKVWVGVRAERAVAGAEPLWLCVDRRSSSLAFAVARTRLRNSPLAQAMEEDSDGNLWFALPISPTEAAWWVLRDVAVDRASTILTVATRAAG